MIALAIIIGVVLVAVLLFAMTRRSDRQAAIGLLSRETMRKDRSADAIAPLAAEAPPAPTGREVERAAVLERSGSSPATTGGGVAVLTDTRPVPVALPPLDEEALGVTRRQFLNRAIFGVFSLSLAGFGAACLGFLWPTLSGGFGSKVNAGKKDDILAKIRDSKAPFYVPEARTYINPFPPEGVAKAKAAGYADPILAGYQEGFVALYQKCVHLGCRVPWCSSSQWFECPCHGSQYNRVGEKKGGPAPRGLDRFAITVDGGNVVVDTKTIFQGPVIGTNTTGQEAEGPHCR